ncbi:MAG: hypothetical protein IKX20_03350, partial [Paludibacteraceae bacterium]|nr:hypothetical protein [Paludibacteraceae bacterium]
MKKTTLVLSMLLTLAVCLLHFSPAASAKGDAVPAEKSGDVAYETVQKAYDKAEAGNTLVHAAKRGSASDVFEAWATGSVDHSSSVDVWANLNETVELSVSVNAENMDSVSYQWYKNQYVEEYGYPTYVLIEGATGATLLTEAVTKPTNYYCLVENDGVSVYVYFSIRVENHFSAWTVYSDEYRTEVTIPVEANTPVDLNVFVEADHEEGITYQWYQELYREETHWYEYIALEGATTSTLNIGIVTGPSAYYCCVKDAYDNDCKVWFSVYVNNDFKAWAAPSAVHDNSYTMSVEPNASCDLEVSVYAEDSDGVTYQWYHEVYNGYQTEYVAIDGANDSTLSMNNITEYSRYSCCATDKYKNICWVYFTVSIDNDFSVTAPGLVDLWDNTVVMPVDLNQSVTLSVSANAREKDGITYQWAKMHFYDVRYYNSWSDEEITGATNSEYTVDPVTQYSGYSCLVQDKYGNSRTIYFKLYVDNDLRVWATDSTEHANSVDWTVNPNETITFSVSVDAIDVGGISYHWSKETVNAQYGYWQFETEIPEATSYTLTVDTATQKSRYCCEVSDKYGNYDFVYFGIEIANNLSAWVAGSENHAESCILTAQPNESIELSVSVSAYDENGITYQWYKRYDIDESSFTWKAVYAATQDSYRIDSVNKNTEYYCVVTDKYGNTSICYFTVNVDNEFLAWITDTEAQETYKSFYVLPGEPVNLSVSVSAVDSEGITYRWYRWVDGYRVKIDRETAGTYSAGVITKPTSYVCYVQDKYGNSQQVEFSVAVDNGFKAWVTDSVWEDSSCDLYVSPGAFATLSVSVNATDPEGVTIQWYKVQSYEENGYTHAEYVLIEDATTNTLVTDCLTEYSDYKCLVEDKYGNSQWVSFYIRINNNFKVWPAGSTEGNNSLSLRVSPNETANLSVEVSADDPSGITYLWYKIQNYEENGSFGSRDVLIENETADTLVTDGISEYSSYYCVAMDKYGNAGYAYFYISVDNNFSAHAANYVSQISVSPNSTAALSVEISADDPDGITYSWYKQQERIEDGVIYSDNVLIENANTSSIVTDSITEYSNYSCQVKDKYGNERWVYFYIRIENNFRAWPAGTTGGDSYILMVGLNETANLSVEVSADDPSGITYDWYTKGNLIENTTTGSIVTDNITKYTSYSCKVTDRYGNSRWVYFYIYVDNNFKAWVTDSNGENSSCDLYVKPKETAYLSVSVSASDPDGITYQWYKWQFNGYSGNNVLVENATTASLVTDSITGYTQYSCRVADKYGSDQWVYFYINVNNSFKAWATASAEESSSYYFSVDPYEEALLSVSVSAEDTDGITYKWFREERYWVDDGYWHTYNIELDDAASASITTEMIASSATYYCKARDKYNNTQTVWFYITVDNGFSAWATPSEDRNSSYSLSVRPKTVSELSVTIAAADTSNASYQWYRNCYNEEYGYKVYMAVDGATGSTFTTDPATDNEQYYCYVQDGYGNSTKVYYYVYVENDFAAWATDSSEHSGSYSYMADPNTTVSLSVTATAFEIDRISYQWYRVCYEEGQGSRTEKLDGATGTKYTTENLTEFSSYYCVVNDGYGSSREIWFSIFMSNNFSAWVTGSMEHNIYGSIGVDPNTPAVLSVTATAGDISKISYQWYRAEYDENGCETDYLIENATEAQYTTENLTSELTHAEYRCIVSDGNENSCSVWIYVYIDNNFSAWPTDSSNNYYTCYLTVEKNASADLSVSTDAKDTSKISYQWYHLELCENEYGTYDDFLPIEGATSAQYSTESITNETDYYCYVTDGYGGSASVGFHISVAEAPGIVTFVSNEQELKSISGVSIGASDYPNEPVSADGYEFTGWDKTLDEINSALAAGETITVTAQWKEIVVFQPTLNMADYTGIFVYVHIPDGEDASQYTVETTPHNTVLTTIGPKNKVLSKLPKKTRLIGEREALFYRIDATHLASDEMTDTVDVILKKNGVVVKTET